MREREGTIVHSFIQSTLPVVYYVSSFILGAQVIKIQSLFSNSSQSHEFADSKRHLDSALCTVIDTQWTLVGQ